ncbi:hypothetical protein EBZ57_00225 [bacterium]|jgi:hypothetical protein|nr:hypothetical protein [bacterium]
MAEKISEQKKYFHDHFVLLLLSLNAFLAVAGSIATILRMSTSHGTGYIVQYRANLGVNAFKTGVALDIVSFVVFFAVVLVANAVLSYRVYTISRELTITILSLGLLLLSLAIIVSNSLLALR